MSVPNFSRLCGAAAGIALAAVTAPSFAATPCPATHDALLAALKASVKPGGGPSNGGLDNNEWAAVVDRAGTVCAIAFSGAKADDQWLGSRAICAEKAFTANGLSLKAFAISTANLWAASQSGGSLFGLIMSNPVDARVIYAPPASDYGTASPPRIVARAMSR